jgi:hypothetical protein
MKITFDMFPARILVIPPSESLDALEYESITFRTEVQSARRVEAVRVVLTERTIMIAGDSSNGPVLIFQEKYDPSSIMLQKNRSKPARVTTLTGKVIIFEKDENCGCGSRLRAWNPYRTVYSTKDPIE